MLCPAPNSKNQKCNSHKYGLIKKKKKSGHEFEKTCNLKFQKGSKSLGQLTKKDVPSGTGLPPLPKNIFPA